MGGGKLSAGLTRTSRDDGDVAGQVRNVLLGELGVSHGDGVRGGFWQACAAGSRQVRFGCWWWRGKVTGNGREKGRGGTRRAGRAMECIYFDRLSHMIQRRTGERVLA